MIQYTDGYGLASQVDGILKLLGSKQTAYLEVEKWINNDPITCVKGCNIECLNGVYDANMIISYCDKYDRKLSIHIK